MFNTKEIATIAIISVILGFIVAFTKEITLKLFLYGFFFILITILLNITAKKIIAYYLDSEIEIKIWNVKNYGFKPSQHFKKDIPIGIFAPVILLIISFAKLKWLASLVFDVKPKIYRAVKRHGLYSYSEMTEFHIGVIAAAGIFTNLIASIIFYFLGFADLSRLNIYYAMFNMLPISDLDGNKIFFGSLILWSFIATLTLIAIGYALLLQ